MRELINRPFKPNRELPSHSKNLNKFNHRSSTQVQIMESSLSHLMPKVTSSQLFQTHPLRSQILKIERLPNSRIAMVLKDQQSRSKLPSQPLRSSLFKIKDHMSLKLSTRMMMIIRSTSSSLIDSQAKRKLLLNQFHCLTLLTQLRSHIMRDNRSHREQPQSNSKSHSRFTQRSHSTDRLLPSQLLSRLLNSVHHSNTHSRLHHSQLEFSHRT